MLLTLTEKMPLFHILILALVQGISEFLPISSSGHLVLTHALLGNAQNDMCWQTNRLLDVAVHVGTLMSVLIYFRKDLFKILANITKPDSDSFGLGANVIIASLPVIIIGFIFQKIQPDFVCLLEIMAWMTIIFGIVLYFADKFNDSKPLSVMNKKESFVIGLSQALALVPGVSRSGITMTSARFLGFSRVDCAKFSLLLSIIAISGAGLLGGIETYKSGNAQLGMEVVMAIILSFLSGLIAIHLMMKWLAKATFKPFVIYRILLGAFLLVLIYGNFLGF